VNFDLSNSTVDHKDFHISFEMPSFASINPEEIDAIFISNYYQILALPYITEFTNFNGKIFATTPTIDLGR